MHDFQVWLLRGLAVQVPLLVIGIGSLTILYRREVLTRASFEIWAIAFLGVLAVAGTVYLGAGMRRMLAARAAAEGKQ